MPQRSLPDGLSSTTPHCNHQSTWLESSGTVASNVGHPSSPVISVMGVEDQAPEYRPTVSQLPRSRTFRKIGRFSPVMYTKRTGIWAMSSLLSGAGGGRGPSGGGRGILLVHEPLADLDDVALGVREPGGLPARDEAVERERAQGDHGLGAHLANCASTSST